MLRQSSFAVLLWVLAIVLVPWSMANAHLHFCLDGQQAPVSLHVQDESGHDDSHGDHQDVDIDMPATTVAKAPHAGDDGLTAFLPLYVLAILVPEQQHEAPRPTVVVVATGALAHWRPPVRGPPSTSDRSA